MANPTSVWRLLFQAQSNIPPVLERDIKAIDKLESRAKKVLGPGGPGAGPGGGGGGVIDRILNKLLPGGGLGNALGGAAGGGLGSTLGIGLGFLGVQWGRQAIADAQAMDTNREANEKAVADIVRYSDATVTSLASLGNQLAIFYGILKRIVGGQLSQGFNIARWLGGGAASAVARAGSSVAGALGLSSIASAIGSVGDYAEDQSARGILGLMGDSSDQDVGRAMERLAEARRNPRSRRRRAARSAGRSPDGYTPAADDLARMGLFVGGGASNTETLLREQIRKLEEIRSGVRDVPKGIAENL